MTKRSKVNRGKRRSRKGGVVKGGSSRAFSNIYREPSRFPLLPKELQLALCYEYHDERIAHSGQSARITPLVEFDTKLPRFAAELYQIYRHARIMAIDFSMDVVNIGTTPLLAAMACLPLAVCNGVTNPQTVISVPGAIRKQIGTNTGMSRAVLRKRFVTNKELGELTLGSNTYLQTYSEALSAAVWTELPAIYAGVVSAQNGQTWSAIVEYRYTMHIRWSEYNIPALGLNDDDLQDYPESMDDKEPSYVAPSIVQQKTDQQAKVAGKIRKPR